MEVEDLHITDHAVVRYLERVLNIEIDELKKTIISDKLRALIMSTGDGCYPVGNGQVAVVQNSRVITVAPHRSNRAMRSMRREGRAKRRPRRHDG